MILLTGATGFVGAHLFRTLEAQGKPVRGTSRRPSERLFHVGDLTPETNWTRALEGVETIVHLAARAHIKRETAVNPLAEYRRVNTHATLNLARRAHDAGVKRFVFVSSIAVNGNTTKTDHPFRETDVPRPHDNYGQSKLEAENALWRLAEVSGLEVTIVRPPLVYGPGVPSNFKTMMHWLWTRLPLPLAAVDNRRSLVSVSNLCDFLVRCCEHPSAPGETFLVSDGQDLSTPELLRRLGSALDKPARLFPVPPEFLRISAKTLGRELVARRLLASLQLDIAKAHALLDWSPPQEIDEAIGETAHHFKVAMQR